MRTPILLSWSGGKDAAWTLHVLRQRDDVEVVGLLTTITEGFERVAMQGIRVDVLHAQAAAAGLPVLEARMPQRSSNQVYEATFAEALARARQRWPELREIAFGDLFLADIRAYREALCARLDWTPRFPLFPSDTAALAREMQAGGLRASLCCVDTTQLDAGSRGANSTPRCCPTCRPASIPAARTASSTPSPAPGRCSQVRWRWNVAKRCCATGASPIPTSPWPGVTRVGRSDLDRHSRESGNPVTLIL